MTSVYLSSLEYPKVISAVALGAFDGVHIGHQFVVNQLIARGRRLSLSTVIYTFRRNPKLTTQGIEGLLSTNSERVEAISRMGVDAIVLEDFSGRFQNMIPEDFVKEVLLQRLNAQLVVVGQGFRFGRERSGNTEMMAEILRDAGCKFIVVPPVLVDGTMCSSSTIREAIAAGDVERAARFLGRPYLIEGVIVTGNRIGKRLGFPTANIEVPDPIKLLPGNGVYAVRAVINGDRVDGVCNIGVRPTIATASRRTVEVHLLGFDRQVYGHLIAVEFVARVRDEVCFSSPAALARQIRRDIAAAVILLQRNDLGA